MVPPVPRSRCGLPIPRRGLGSRRALRQLDDVAASTARAATTSPWLAAARLDAIARRAPPHHRRHATSSQGHAGEQELRQRPVTSLGIRLPVATAKRAQDCASPMERPEGYMARSATSMAGYSDDSGSDVEQMTEPEVAKHSGVGRASLSPYAMSSAPSSGFTSRLQNRTYMTALSDTPDRMLPSLPSNISCFPCLDSGGNVYTTAVHAPPLSEPSEDRPGMLSQRSQRSWASNALDEVLPPPCKAGCQGLCHHSKAETTNARRKVINTKVTCHTCIAFTSGSQSAGMEKEEHQRLVAQAAPHLNPRTRRLFQEIQAAGRFPQKGAAISARFVGLDPTASKISSSTGFSDGRQTPITCPKGWKGGGSEDNGQDSRSVESIPPSEPGMESEPSPSVRGSVDGIREPSKDSNIPRQDDGDQQEERYECQDGQSLHQGQLFQDAANAEKLQSDKFCNVCGHGYMPECKFCHKCGKPRTDIEAVVSESGIENIEEDVRESSSRDTNKRSASEEELVVEETSPQSLDAEASTCKVEALRATLKGAQLAVSMISKENRELREEFDSDQEQSTPLTVEEHGADIDDVGQELCGSMHAVRRTSDMLKFLRPWRREPHDEHHEHHEHLPVTGDDVLEMLNLEKQEESHLLEPL